ncbi:predicted protein [Scheffersomyces stipitis CBS 6054]|uniref:Uncharacterized protein n=1 Tax=Scheffersomyces stipitis (strain ATCC 58785 / CBS 6054 / NBRC 10063 / NRRL Y-11545) TaxID=322104 RepID=A3LWV0_PICST|nr:predicted protein [Scheffersomyces stipitis CBS 6054]ABN67342.2 predicted protein [Scheffersomyces stipitis CBS 6054]KAG2732205.1 hypothetical protein G9P44_004622 [Scheffersomyces stipitis]
MLPPITVAGKLSDKDTPLPSPDLIQTPHLHFNSTYVTSSSASNTPPSGATIANCTCSTASQNPQPHPTVIDTAILENTPRTTILVNHSGTSSEKSNLGQTQYFPSVTPPTISANPEITTVDDDANQSSSLSKDERLDEIKKQCSQLISELDANPNPEEIVRKHIIMLNKYNELKDIALGLVTMIADQRHIRTTDILEEVKVEHNPE